MGFRLPRLVHAVDVGDWQPRYAGIVLEILLNPPVVEFEGEDGDRRAGLKPAPTAGHDADQERAAWDTAFYHGAAARLVRLVVPGELTDSGQEEAVELDSAEAVYRLERRADFDPAILAWILSEYGRLRNEYLAGALKN